MRVLLVVLLVLALVLLAGIALATTRATTDMALIRGSPPVVMTIVATSTYMANSYGTADCLAGSITPTARTGPHFVAFTPCTHESVGTFGSTYCDDELHPAAPISDNPGARRLDGPILQTTTGRSTTSAAFA